MRTLIGLALAGLLVAAPARADIVSNWHDVYVTVDKAQTSPNFRFDPELRQASSVVAIAMFEAANSIDRRYVSYLKLPAAPATGSVDAAVSTAARDTLLAFYPGEAKTIGDAYTAAMAAVPAGAAREAGIAAGKAAAVAALAIPRLDPKLPPVAYRPKGDPGVWSPSVLPYDARMSQFAPWVMTSADELRPGPPVKLTSPEWAKAFNEVKLYGARESKARSEAATLGARFWAQYDLEMALREVVGQPGRRTVQNARTYALVSIAGDDADLLLNDGKMHHLSWRPMNAIRQADDDGNPDTVQDVTWVPLLNTPNQPEYPCGHCVYAWTMATILDAEGPVAGGVDFTNANMAGVRMNMPTFAAYAKAVSQSRIDGGVHFRTTNEPSDAIGVKLGRITMERFAPPAR